jgi:starch synthase
MAERTVVREAQAIVSLSSDNQELLNRIYPETQKKTVSIPNGVDIQTFCPRQTRDVFAAHGLPASLCDYVLFVGRASRQKGLEYFLPAARALPPEIPIVIATSTRRWDGEEYPHSREYLEAIAKLQGERARVHVVHDEWDRSRLCELYSHAALAVVTSTYEPGCMVALEAQACGVPIVANKVGIIKDALVGNEAGVFLEPETSAEASVARLVDAIASLYRDQYLREAMGRRARPLIEASHSWERRAAQHVELYEKVSALREKLQ